MTENDRLVFIQTWDNNYPVDATSSTYVPQLMTCAEVVVSVLAKLVTTPWTKISNGRTPKAVSDGEVA